ACDFQEANFLVGVKGQTAEMMLRDVELGLRYFQRININVMCDNTTPVKPDQGVIDIFMREIYPLYKDDERVDILLHNTDFTVGTPT
ncbi:radical SAM protein, partial [bacterium]|nr:radical SAM protein [bacterium]